MEPILISISGAPAMFDKIYNFLWAQNLCVAALILVWCVSCTAPLKEDEQPFDDRFFAENSVMKKRLPLIERENDVLKKENHQHRTRIQELESRIKELDLELASLSEKYAGDMATAEEKIDTLLVAVQTLEAEGSAKILELNSLNTALEEKRAQEVQALNEQITTQKNSFRLEREKMIQEYAQRELNFSTQLGEMEKSLDTRELEVLSLKLAIGEISTKLGEATALAAVLAKARDESATELESVKAANTDLIKKMDTLVYELSLQNRPPKENN
jgi:chromosome segregation ATPase